MSNISPFRSLIEEIANELAIQAPLICAMIRVESGGNPNAARYEPAFYTRYISPMRGKVAKPGCSEETERRLRATSHGLLQIMGQVARERGFDGQFLTELYHPRIGIWWGARQIEYLRRRHVERHGWVGVVRAYNTGRPQSTDAGDRYLAKVIDALREDGYTMDDLSSPMDGAQLGNHDTE